jgi:hypothetical protein
MKKERARRWMTEPEVIFKSQSVRDSFKRTCPSNVNQYLFRDKKGDPDVKFARSSDRRVNGCNVIGSNILNQA